jgi:hypothetical protein
VLAGNEADREANPRRSDGDDSVLIELLMFQHRGRLLLLKESIVRGDRGPLPTSRQSRTRSPSARVKYRRHVVTMSSRSVQDDCAPYPQTVGENVDELAQRITEYAATVDEANKRTLDPIIVELMCDLGLT